MKKKGIQLYNVIFPIWLLWLIPTTWIVVLPANFLIDSAVLLLTMKHLKIENKMRKVKSVIARVWIAGFLADFIGTAVMFLACMIDFENDSAIGNWWYDNISNAVSYNPFHSVFSVLWVTGCVLIASCFIYLFNYKVCLRRLDVEEKQKRKLALSMAVFTAPYLFYLPTNLFY